MVFVIWLSDTKQHPKLCNGYFSCDVWLTHPCSQQVITLVDIFFLITDVKLLSDHFYSLSPRILQRCVCERFDLYWKHTPLQIMDSFSCHPKLNFSKMKVVLCISAELAFKFALLWGWKITNIKTNVCLVSKSAKMIDYLKSMVDFRSSLIYRLIFSILHVTFKRH